MLIGNHHDWVKNFPFEALGLSNKYEIAPASVSEFGFTYDDRIIKKFGGFVWPGVRKAEEDFARRVAQANISPAEMRRVAGDLYRAQLGLTRKLVNAEHSIADFGLRNAD